MVTRTQVFSLEEGETKEAVQWRDASQVEEVRLDQAQEIMEQHSGLREKLQKDYNDKRPDYQSGANQNQLIVNTELVKGRVPLNGFLDNVVITEVPKAAQYGVVADGLYPVDEIAATGGSSAASSATGATSAGTVSAAAATTGLSTAATIGVVLGTAAVVGGIAAAAGGGGGGGGGVASSGPSTACNQRTEPGGNAPETHTIELGRPSGTFRFDYDTRFQEDRMIVTYQGATIFDSGCLGTGGTRTANITYSGGSTQVVVSVQPNCAGGTGTTWEFTVYCP